LPPRSPEVRAVRILYLHPNSWIGEYAMLCRLRDLGHEMFVLEEMRGKRPGRRRQLAEHFKAAGDGIRTLWYDPHRGWERLVTWVPDRVFRRAFDGRNLVHRMWVIPEAVRAFSPDAVVCSDGFTYGIPAGFLKRLGWRQPRLIISYIGGDIGDAPLAEYGHHRTRFLDWMFRASYLGADVLRPVSPSLVEILQKDGAPTDRIRMCPSHLVASESVLADIRSRRARVRAEVRGRYGIAGDAPLVVTLSGNQLGKGMHVLAEAWPAIVSACPGARWLLCGQHHPWLDRAVWPLLEREGLRGTVIAAGRIEAPSTFEHLAAAEINANPTIYEGLNMVAVEAAAVGTPTITGDGAGIAHWIDKHRSGAVVLSGDAVGLAAAVIAALRDRDLLSRWSAASIEMAKEFSLESISRQLLEIIGAPPSAPN
jgi:glycosyltransferase involved in cell wall biosynthesis